jgi:protein-S-isoprenylcysteine O-methyltransferase Ste14
MAKAQVALGFSHEPLMFSVPFMHLLHEYLFPVLWLAWGIGWLASSRWSSAEKRRQTSPERGLYLAEMAVAVALLSFPKLGYGWLGERVLQRTEALFVVGAVLLVIGLGFTVWARLSLGRNWSGYVTLKAGHRLVRSGPYALVRHPIYTGLLFAMLGSTIATDEWRAVLGLALATASLFRKLRLEERWLAEEFGSEYAAYKDEVKALVPWLI